MDGLPEGFKRAYSFIYSVIGSENANEFRLNQVQDERDSDRRVVQGLHRLVHDHSTHAQVPDPAAAAAANE
jgi:hypothetical protein